MTMTPGDYLMWSQSLDTIFWWETNTEYENTEWKKNIYLKVQERWGVQNNCFGLFFYLEYHAHYLFVRRRKMLNPIEKKILI